MKKKLLLMVAVLLTSIFLMSCEDRSDLTAPNPPTPNLGAVNFTNFVTIGNSLTAGYQSGSLFESAQMYAFGNLIAQQVGTSYAQPIIADPGIKGRIEIKSLSPFTLTYNQNAGAPTNLSYPKPYNNLGIPGIVLADVLTATETANSYSKSGAIAATGAKVVIGNIPEVTAIPFFTTVGPGVAQKLASLNITAMYYQQHGQYNGTVLPVSALANYSVLMTLLGSNYTSYLGIPSGKFYKDNSVDISPLIAAGILDTNQA